MKMVEQNISGVKLERLRQNAVKKHKILRKLLPVCLILFIGLTLVKNRFLFVSISEYGFGDPATQGGLLGLIGGLMLSVIFAGAILGFYYMLVYKKAYDLFCINFKNKYVLDTLRQLPDFSELRYNAGGGLSYEEMNRLKLIPGGQSVFYQSSDELSGKLDGVPFRAVNVCTGEKLPQEVLPPKFCLRDRSLFFPVLIIGRSVKVLSRCFLKKPCLNSGKPESRCQFRQKTVYSTKILRCLQRTSRMLFTS